MTKEEFKNFTPETSALIAKMQEGFEERRKPITEFSEAYKEKISKQVLPPEESHIQDLEYSEIYLKQWINLLMWKQKTYDDLLLELELRYINLHEGQSKRLASLPSMDLLIKYKEFTKNKKNPMKNAYLTDYASEQDRTDYIYLLLDQVSEDTKERDLLLDLLLAYQKELQQSETL